MKNILKSLLVLFSIYALLALCNWSFKVIQWTPFSVFVLGFVGFIIILNIFDEL